MRFIRDANVTHIQRFLKCILHSPIINHLSINFGVHSVAFHLPQGWTFGREVEEMQRAVNRQARDMFVHCGVLGPFRALHNVRSFNLGFFQDRNTDGFPVWLAELAEDIKLTVERNFCAEQDTN